MPENLIELPSGAAAAGAFTTEAQKGIILLVALGDGQREKDFVKRAQFMVGGDSDPAVVVWAKEPTNIMAQLATLANPSALDVAGAAAVACAISMQGEIVDVIGQHEDPTFFRILKMISKAAAQ